MGKLDRFDIGRIERGSLACSRFGYQGYNPSEVMAMAVEKPGDNPDELHPRIAFLIVDGSQVVTIEKAITSIGRKSDNQIVIKNEHVSRYHAQIKRVKGAYILQDLNSTVGTSVNGIRIESITLKPGDVISVGGVPLIFGEGTPLEGFESSHNKAGSPLDSSPTNKTDIQSADQYLDMFNSQQDGEP